MGVQNMLQFYIPDVKEVIQVWREKGRRGRGREGLGGVRRIGGRSYKGRGLVGGA